MKAAVVLILLVALCSCSSTPADDDRSARERFGAPVVPTPRDVASRAADPCGTLLSAAQIRTLGYDEQGEASTTLAGSPNCGWEDRRTGRMADVAVSVDKDLFVSTYQNRVVQEFAPIQVQGLPAVNLRSSGDASICTTTVGTGDRDAVDVTAFVPDSADPAATDSCAESVRVAEAVVSTLPPRR